MEEIMPVNTTKNMLFDEAPAEIVLRGDKKRKIEASTHIIEFPGGAIELSRTGNGEYWAHIIVNHEFADADNDGLHKAYGKVVDTRIDYEFPADPCIVPIANEHQIHQVAIRIRPVAAQQWNAETARAQHGGTVGT
jgi:hypothetical protein